MLADRLYDAMTATFDLLAVYVGERLGWYEALREPRTPAELAAATSTNERYAREWLEHQAAGGILTVADGRYELPPEHAEVLLDEESCRGAPTALTAARPRPRSTARCSRTCSRRSDCRRFRTSTANAGETPVRFEVRDIVDVSDRDARPGGLRRCGGMRARRASTTRSCSTSSTRVSASTG
jgi:hypothetical protein